MGASGGDPFRDPEQLNQHRRQPETGGGGAKQVHVLGEALPNRAVIGLVPSAIARRNAHLCERNPLADQHAQNVVIGQDEEFGRGTKTRGWISQ
nr:hypothetical protein [Chloroflexus sp.]